MTRRPSRGAAEGPESEARPKPPRADMDHMDHEVRTLVFYTLCAEAVVVAGLILKYERSYMLGAIALQTGWPGARGFVAIAIIATVFGVSAMRRPIASLIGAVLAIGLFNEGRSSEPVNPSLLPPFIWISWLQGRLAYWVVRFLRFAHRLITRPDQPSLGGAAKPEAEAPNERAQVDEATPNTGATA